MAETGESLEYISFVSEIMSACSSPVLSLPDAFEKALSIDDNTPKPSSIVQPDHCEGFDDITGLLSTYGVTLHLGDTPLLAAILDNKPELVRILLERGADPNENKEHSTSPLEMAANLRFPDVVKVLLQHGAVFDRPWYPVWWIGYQPGGREVLKLLLEYNAYVDTKHIIVAFQRIDHDERLARGEDHRHVSKDSGSYKSLGKKRQQFNGRLDL
jgi:FOG: Ankyrin repeat